MNSSLYCLSNKYYGNIYKIGITSEDPAEYAKSLYSPGIIEPFRVELAKLVVGGQEEILASILPLMKCINKEHGFYECPIESIKLLFNLVKEPTQATEVLTPKKASKKQAKCRNPKLCFEHGQMLRHTIMIGEENSTIYFAYNLKKNMFEYNNSDHKTMGKIIEAHYKLVNFAKIPKNKAWKECEYLTVGENSEEIWTSTNDIIPGQKPVCAPKPGQLCLEF
jgi:hypothetical protein